MEEYRSRVRRHGAASGWLAGRRAWSAVRTAAVLDAGSTVRRALRDTKAQATRPVSLHHVDASAHPALRRVRSKLASGDAEQIARGAQQLLELIEPDSLESARRAAFAGAAPPPGVDAALTRAWEEFRHDRYRAVE